MVGKQLNLPNIQPIKNPRRGQMKPKIRLKVPPLLRMKIPYNLELRRGVDMREPLVPERLGGEPPKVTGCPIVKKDGVRCKTRQPRAGIPALPRVYSGANQ